MRPLSAILITSLFACLLCGCGPKRTELGYGFYELEEPAGHIIRRERNDEGEVVDQNWWPSRYDLKGRKPIFWSMTDNCLIFFLSPDGSVTPQDEVTRKNILEFLHSTVEIVVLRLDEAAFQELGMYNDIAAQLDPDDPTRVQIDRDLALITDLIMAVVKLFDIVD